MSRIDDALKRISGTGAEPRVPSVLERFASEGKTAKVEEPRKTSRADEHKVAAFVAPGPHPVDVPAGPHAVDARPAPPKLPPTPVAPVAPPVVAAHVAEPPADPNDADSGDNESLIDIRQLTDYIGFVVRALGRHKLLAASTFVVALALTVAGAFLMPRTYFVQAKLLAQRNAVMAALSNPGRAVPWDADAPTRAAAETVLRRDNLISLITQTDLINEWNRTRVPILKLKDWLRATIMRHELTPDEQLDSLVGLLESRMRVEAGPVGDGTVTIELQWPDAQMAYRLVEAAQQAFLEARQVAETSAIGESIAILERYSASLHQDINRTLSELQRTQANRRTAVPRPRLPVVRRSLAPTVGQVAAALGAPPLDPSLEPNTELNQLKAKITTKKQEVTRLEDARERQLSELQGRLAQLTTVYTPTHPSVMAAQQNLAALMHEPAQLVNLKADLKDLETEYDKLSAAAADAQIEAELARRSAAANNEPAQVAAPIEQPSPIAEALPTTEFAEFATLRLRSELNQLESVLERTDGARIELAVSQAAFKYRYSVITPAQVPRDPIFPNVRLVIAAGFFGSLLLAFGVAVARDFLSNRVIEPWQVERQLGLPILGTVRIR